MRSQAINEAEGFWIVVVAASGEIISTHMSKGSAEAAIRRYEAADRRRSNV